MGCRRSEPRARTAQTGRVGGEAVRWAKKGRGNARRSGLNADARPRPDSRTARLCSGFRRNFENSDRGRSSPPDQRPRSVKAPRNWAAWRGPGSGPHGASTGPPRGPRRSRTGPGRRRPGKGFQRPLLSPGRAPRRPGRIQSAGSNRPDPIGRGRRARRGEAGRAAGPGSRRVRPRRRIQAPRARATDSSSRAVPTASSRVTGAGPPAAIAASRARTSSS